MGPTIHAEGGAEAPDADGARFARFAPALLALVVAFSFQGSRGLYETTEGRYAECAREMIASGNYLEPTLEGVPHWTKPPLAYWSIAAGVGLLGLNAWGARLYLAVAFVLTTLLVGAIGKTLWDRRSGRLCGLVYATSFFPASAAHVVSTDMLLTLFVTAAVYCFLRARAGGRRRLFVVLMWLCFGLAFLTKGPPSLLLLVPILLWNHRQRDRVALLSVPGLLLFVVVGLGWYLLEVLRHPGLLQNFLGAEVVGRVFGDEFDRSPEWYQPFVRYLPVLLFGAGLWSVFLVGVARSERLYSPAALYSRLRGADTGAFLLLWLLLPLVVFFIAKSRMYLYVLPLFTAIALSIGRYLARRESVPWSRWLAVALIGGLLITAGKGVYAHQRSKHDMAILAAACRSIDAGAPVFVVEESRMHGLMFYLDGRMRRLALDVERKWADETINMFVARYAADRDLHPIVMVMSSKYEDEVVDFLQDSGLAVSVHGEGDWNILHVDGTGR